MGGEGKPIKKNLFKNEQRNRQFESHSNDFTSLRNGGNTKAEQFKN